MTFRHSVTEPNVYLPRWVPEFGKELGPQEMTSTNEGSVTADVARSLAHLRRYGRALTGNQFSGDRFAEATLEAILADPTIIGSSDRKLGIFRVFHSIWFTAGAPLSHPDTTLSARAQLHMAELTKNSREALLLHVIEGFTLDQIGVILGTTPDAVADLVQIAMQEMEASVSGAVMVIEDEAIIAADIVDIVRGTGHRVTGIARTQSEALALALGDRPDLVLADIQLADRSSGIDAVNDILKEFPETPVIFITAFPERLLTGERREPAFLLTKPFSEDQLRSAVGQAMFFASTETLTD
jgi:CheY-like chemotaxis protein